jgi:hypothetical protein
MPVSAELAADPAALRAARIAKREHYLETYAAEARRKALMVARTDTCTYKPVSQHGSCLGLDAGGGLGCLCECHDPEATAV